MKIANKTMPTSEAEHDNNSSEKNQFKSDRIGESTFCIERKKEIKNMAVEISKRLLCKYFTLNKNSNGFVSYLKFSSEVSAKLKVRPFDEIPEINFFSILGSKNGFPFMSNFDSKYMHNTLMNIHREYGECVKVPKISSGCDIILLSNPEDIKKVYESSIERFNNKSINIYKNDLRKDVFKKYRGLVDVSVEDWFEFKNRLKRIKPLSKIAYENISVMEKLAVNFVNILEESIDENDETPDYFFIELKKLAIELHLNIILDDQISQNSRIKTIEIKQILDGLLNIQETIRITDYLPYSWSMTLNTSNWKRTYKMLDNIMSLIKKYADNIEKNGRREDSSSLLHKYSDKDELDVLTIFAFDNILIGPNSVSSVLSILLYQLSLHQDVQDILYREIKSQLLNKNEVLTKEKLQNMNYLSACIQETMRLCPITVVNTRSLIKDMILSGYHVPKGTKIILSQFTTSNSNDYFNSSTKFQPERWLKGNCDVQQCASAPYGYGERMCPAMEMSDLQIKIVICKIIQKYKIKYNREELKLITKPPLELDGPLILTLKER